MISPFKTLILGCFTVLSRLRAFYIISVAIAIGELVLGIVVTNGVNYKQPIHSLANDAEYNYKSTIQI